MNRLNRSLRILQTEANGIGLIIVYLMNLCVLTFYEIFIT
jgi:hypothetical protein